MNFSTFCVNKQVNVAIWTDNDLDGAGCALILSLIYNKDNITICEWNESRTGEIKGWLNNNYSKYDKIFITDISIPENLIECVDKEKIIIIDHHKTHAEYKDKYKVAKTFITEETSCTRYLQNILKKALESYLTPERELLFNIIDDYDNYTLKFSETLKLNTVFNSYNNPRVEKFIKEFYNGMREFNTLELNAIKLAFNKLKEEISNLEFYFGDIKGHKVVSCFASGHSTNEIAHYALKKTQSEIAMVTVLSSKTVSFRKKKDCPIELNKLAKVLCDGGGHAYAAGGKITENFLKFTKTLICY